MDGLHGGYLGGGAQRRTREENPPPLELSSVLYLDPSRGFTNASYSELHQALHLKPMAWTHEVNKDILQELSSRPAHPHAGQALEKQTLALPSLAGGWTGETRSHHLFWPFSPHFLLGFRILKSVSEGPDP